MSQFDLAIKTFKNGGVVIFPTDTVWGIGAWVESQTGIESLYRIKRREPEKPTALLVGSVEQAQQYGHFESWQLDLVGRYWPGALTVVVPALESVPKILLNKNGGVGIRFPHSERVTQLCLTLPGGIVASSANVAGGSAPQTFSQVSESLIASADLVLHDDVTTSGVASTVVDLMHKDLPMIIRQGGVILE